MFDTDNQQVPEAILDKLTKTCTCLSITRKTIKDAIADGAETIPAIQKATRCGSGACRGKNCTPRIVRILQDMGKLPKAPQKK